MREPAPAPAQWLEQRARSWILRRQGRDVDPVELRRNRIYILPTRVGFTYAAMLFAMLLGGMNYNNNLGLALHVPARGARARHDAPLPWHADRPAPAPLAAEPGFVGDTLRFRWLLENDASVPRPAIELEIQHVSRDGPRWRKAGAARSTCQRHRRGDDRTAGCVAAACHSSVSSLRRGTRSACSAHGPSFIPITRRLRGPSRRGANGHRH